MTLLFLVSVVSGWRATLLCGRLLFVVPILPYEHLPAVGVIPR
jgi:hypothetical protein